MKKILFVNSKPKECGVHAFGLKTYEIIKQSRQYQVDGVELSEPFAQAEFVTKLNAFKPDLILFNWHQHTLSWVTDDFLTYLRAKLPQVALVSLIHDYSTQWQFHAVIHSNPDKLESECEYRTGRIIFDYPKTPAPTETIIGSYGYATPNKKYESIVECANREFERATVRLHLPFGAHCDPEGIHAKATIEQCRALAKPGITVEASHDFKTDQQLMDWLAGNSINCFFYDEVPGSGISSAVDLALAVHRPIAFSDSNMFSHLTERMPLGRITQHSLKDILNRGFEPFEKWRQEWSVPNYLANMERIFDRVLATFNQYNLTSNRVLTANDRVQLQPEIEHLKQLVPDIMSRKVPGAVFQNAFNFVQAKRFVRRHYRVIIVGGFEDPIGPALKKLGYDVTITDPNIDGKDSKAVWEESLVTGQVYDLVIACSVLEHVENDVDFIYHLYSILSPQGVCLLTTDYNEHWAPGQNKPVTDVRLYNAERLRYLLSHLPPNAPLSPLAWEYVEPYFEFENTRYGFASIAFYKSMNYRTHDAHVRQQYLKMQLALEASERAHRLEVDDFKARYHKVLDLDQHELNYAGQLFHFLRRHTFIRKVAGLPLRLLRALGLRKKR